jgi:hypothetical protein
MTNKLLEYLLENGIGQNFFGKKVKCCQSSMCRILRKGQMPTLKLALAIEKQTKGKVTVYDWLPEKKDATKPQNRKKDKPEQIHQEPKI